MSTCKQHDLRPALREPAESWAREELGLPATAGTDEIRLAIFSRLRESNFTPPATWDQAIRIVSDPAAELRDDDDAGSAFLFPYEGLLHAQMSRFCREFFELPPEARREAWEKLRATGGFAPAVVAHLEQLKPALDLRSREEKLPDARAQWLVDLLCAALRAPPPMRAGIEGLILTQVRGKPLAWKQAAKHIRKAWPELAAAVAPFLAELERQAWVASGGVQGILRRNAVGIIASSSGVLAICFFLLTLIGAVINTEKKMKKSQPSHIPQRVVPSREEREREAEKKLPRMLDRDRSGKSLPPGEQP